jgi:Leucine-rich repeat (LRR) protein
MENGFADFICNKENIIETYTELISDKEKIAQLDAILTKFKNLTLLRLNKNRICIIENLPQNLKELHLYSNPIVSLANKLRYFRILNSFLRQD